MPQQTITLCYRKIIDAHSSKPWEKMVFEDSYSEFRMQAQLFDQRQAYPSFSELLAQVKGADQLHFLVSSAVMGYVRQLNGIIPDIINNLGRHFLPFTNFRFEIINSNVFDQTRHQVAINFYSEPLVWHSTIGDYLLISNGQPTQDGELLTHLLQLQPYLSIHSISTPAEHKA
ncbi:MAG: hypothetical protein ACO1OQ_00540 [Rufibacter sp.]